MTIFYSIIVLTIAIIVFLFFFKIWIYKWMLLFLQFIMRRKEKLLQKNLDKLEYALINKEFNLLYNLVLQSLDLRANLIQYGDLEKALDHNLKVLNILLQDSIKKNIHPRDLAALEKLLKRRYWLIKGIFDLQESISNTPFNNKKSLYKDLLLAKKNLKKNLTEIKKTITSLINVISIEEKNSNGDSIIYH